MENQTPTKAKKRHRLTPEEQESRAKVNGFAQTKLKTVQIKLLKNRKSVQLVEIDPIGVILELIFLGKSDPKEISLFSKARTSDLEPLNKSLMLRSSQQLM